MIKKPMYGLVYILWVPDQKEPFQIAARITDQTNLTRQTSAITGLSLKRTNKYVKLCKPYNIPQRWVTRIGEKTECFDIQGNLSNAAAARLAWSSWSPGYMNGEAKWYQWNGNVWIANTLRYVIHGHTCEIRDIDNDGNPDIFIGEMGSPGAGGDAKTYIWYGNGKGSFIETIASHGQGIHEGKLADLDGDGDLDILMKPYNHNSPRVDVLLNKGIKQSPGTNGDAN
ncbi:MAG: VCBS repeat-containing protein [Sedimentisphaerales bacterium]|nr:VCBS repeat-containing protein [Sedimentisphaerales bacterium]